MARKRHAVAGPEARTVRTGPRSHVVLLRTRCGLWMDVETCEDDGRETCKHCRERIRYLTAWDRPR